MKQKTLTILFLIFALALSPVYAVGEVELNQGVIINQPGHNTEINISQGFNASNLSALQDNTNFGGSNFSIVNSTQDNIFIDLRYYNKSGVQPARFNADTVDTHQVNFTFSNLKSGQIYRVLRNGTEIKRETASESGRYYFTNDQWSTKNFTVDSVEGYNSTATEDVSSQENLGDETDSSRSSQVIPSLTSTSLKQFLPDTSSIQVLNLPTVVSESTEVARNTIDSLNIVETSDSDASLDAGFSQVYDLSSTLNSSINVDRTIIQVLNLPTSTSVNNNPDIESVDCLINGTTWKACTQSTTFDSEITKVRAEVTDDSQGSIEWVNFTLADEYDNNFTFQNQKHTSVSGDYYIYDNQDRTINDSGTWNITVTATDTIETTETNQYWSIPWGDFQVTMDKPSTDIDVAQNQTFNMTGTATCTIGECASEGEEAKLWADPFGPITQIEGTVTEGDEVPITITGEKVDGNQEQVQDKVDEFTPDSVQVRPERPDTSTKIKINNEGLEQVSNNNNIVSVIVELFSLLIPTL